MARRETDGRFNIDPAHQKLDIYNPDPGASDSHAITLDVWREKYRWADGNEEHPFDSMRRVVEGIYAKDPNKDAKRDALEAMQKGLWIPAGRIQAGAGTPNVVTLMNCFVSREIEDSMAGIADALKDGMLTMQQGGGDGFNFGSLRPSEAYLARTGAIASGPLPFMDMWNSMCETIMSAGKRRGAMMAVITDDHPDLIKFIEAKHVKGRLTNFNMSVLISDAFLDAVENDEDWHLGFNVPRYDNKHLFVTEKETDDGSIEMWYAYSKYSARDLWDLIIRNTYEWSEPGVIFIDRVNRQNNLNYCETIACTNPCGEQPLPPNGCCNLGAVNLAKMVRDPFLPTATFDLQLLVDVVGVGTRFLDNVIDVTLYPLEAQAKEEYAKRRIGIGITGLANALAQLGLRYGSPSAIEATETIMQTLSTAVIETSIDLAIERGTFPLWDYKYWGQTSDFVQSLDPELKARLKVHGIRNGVLLTIAPTGTTSLYGGNVSSGLEPVFQHKAQRNVRQGDNTYKPYTVYDYGYLLYMSVMGYSPDASRSLPPYMVTHEALTVDEHLAMQAACQTYVDSSVSKTINCPPDITFEDFRETYEKAYKLGCKGCTTYRYSEVRGSILSASPTSASVAPAPILVRPEVLAGRTYKVKWPSVDENYYLTINDVAGKPFEVFIQSTSSKYADWATALSLMISALMRKGGDISFIPEELQKVRSADDAGFVDGKFFGSLVALLGHNIGKHLNSGDIQHDKSVPSGKKMNPQGKSQTHISINARPLGETCPKCNQPAVFRQEGCDSCTNCTYSRCG